MMVYYIEINYNSHICTTWVVPSMPLADYGWPLPLRSFIQCAPKQIEVSTRTRTSKANRSLILTHIRNYIHRYYLVYKNVPMCKEKFLYIILNNTQNMCFFKVENCASSTRVRVRAITMTTHMQFRNKKKNHPKAIFNRIPHLYHNGAKINMLSTIILHND